MLGYIKNFMEDFFNEDWSAAEKILLITDCILVGVIIGFIFAPIKRGLLIGSGNACGNNDNGNTYNDICDDGEEYWLDEEE